MRLTPREVQILRLIAAGLADKEIAGKFGTSPYTVRSQLAVLRIKTGACNRTQLAVMALRGGLDMEAAC